MPTPDEPGKPHERPVLEPIRVLRPRNTDALAELFREMTELTQDPDAYESIPLRPEPQAVDEAETEELPPLSPPEPLGATTATRMPTTTPTPRGGRDWASERGGPRPLPGGDGPGSRDRAARERSGSRAAPAAGGARARARTGSGAGVRRGAITVGVCAAALVGFAGALLLPGRGGEAAAQTPPPAAATPSPADTATAPESVDPDGAGTLREGDSGAEVSDLQQRLLRIPDVYADGPTDGRYDTVLTEAVARFQLWYGIRGDESGVYGDDTRRDLESRTGSAGG
ncbi:peptidoglycan-binding domain-containing protein [Streptomyces sp. Root1310]|uniref:peptidoglycan-binding domain-containing protein n=1 Tax=Streptomyces sp. Root1310 TaxID=1736452 RepID=UPI00070BDC50|nr:peptidoglycan-binding domain-containing protein [Streptomyces sp. Root1310]KQX67490.1 peptidoglycan-binding protein [Streptomyces sp. Root1310]